MITELEYIYFLVALLMGFRLITWVCKVDLFHQLWEAIQKHGCSATAVTAAHASFPVHTLNKEETSIPVRHKRANSQQVENLSKTGYTLLSSLSSFFGAVMKKKHWQFGKTLKGDVIVLYILSQCSTHKKVNLPQFLLQQSNCGQITKSFLGFICRWRYNQLLSLTDRDRQTGGQRDRQFYT